MSKIRAYLICPVRNATAEERSNMYQYVNRLEEVCGYSFHFPHRDVDQSNDDGGVRICGEHLEAMCQCDEVHVWLTSDPLSPERKILSEGSAFDLGMAYTESRHREIKFVIANGPLEKTRHKSFTNLLRSLADVTDVKA